MFDKRLLIVPALVVSTVVGGAIYMSADKKTQLAVSADPVLYSATIDVDHPLLPTQYKTTYAFKLNNPGAYGAFKVTESTAISTDLPKDKKEYAFSWTAFDRSCFQIIIKVWKETYYEIDGVGETLWGIPNPTKVELIYNDAGNNLAVDTKPLYGSNWGNEQIVNLPNGDKSISYTVIDPSVASTYWSTCINTDTSGGGTIYVRSMTIWYTCS